MSIPKAARRRTKNTPIKNTVKTRVKITAKSRAKKSAAAEIQAAPTEKTVKTPEKKTVKKTVRKSTRVVQRDILGKFVRKAAPKQAAKSPVKQTPKPALFEVLNFGTPLSVYDGLAIEQALFEQSIADIVAASHAETTAAMHGDMSAAVPNLAAPPVSANSALDGSRLLFWKSQPAVVMGRNQNPWKECSMPFLEAHGIDLARRDTGGGCVYHDEGNLNITVISKAPDKDFNPVRNLQMLADTLKSSHGIQAEVTERNDVLVGGKKISGSAMRIVRGVMLHHFTVLLNADLSLLRGSLAAAGDLRLETKAVASNPHSVVNIHCASNLLIEEYARRFAAAQHKTPSIKNYKSAADISAAVGGRAHAEQKRLCDKEWILGRTPPFEIFFVLDGLSCCAKFLQGALTEVRRGNDVFFPREAALMERTALLNTAADAQSHPVIRRAAALLCEQYCQLNTG